jgi:peptidoglycan/xylan/chitin deacetylase (PgdA/CDA1 family)
MSEAQAGGAESRAERAGSTPSRWVAKKVARAGLAYAAWASGALAARDLAAAGPQVRALTYHRFGDALRDPFCVSRADFDAQMRWLAERRLLVSLPEVEDFVAGRRLLPRHAVLVTIDDGARSLLTDALPVLRAYAVPAVAFVSPGLIGNAAAGAEQPEPYLDWDELERACAAGVTIGSHGFEHRSLGLMPLAEAAEQAERSREVLERRLGGAVRSFAYPFGTRSDFSAETDRVLREAGYACAFHSMHGAIRPGLAPISLPRVKVEAGEGLHLFQLVSRGALDAWRLVDHVLWRAQRVRRETRA